MKQREVVLCIIAIAIFIIAGASSCKLIKAVTKPLPIEYNIGTGIAKVTDPAIGLGMQGMADDKQKNNRCGVRFIRKSIHYPPYQQQ